MFLTFPWSLQSYFNSISVSERIFGFQGEDMSVLSSDDKDGSGSDNKESDYSADRFSKGESDPDFETKAFEEDKDATIVKLREVEFLNLGHGGDADIEKSDGILSRGTDASTVIIGDKRFPIKRMLVEDFSDLDIETRQSTTDENVNSAEEKTLQSQELLQDHENALEVDPEGVKGTTSTELEVLEVDEDKIPSHVSTEVTVENEPHRNKVEVKPGQTWSHFIPEPTDKELETWKSFRLGPRVAGQSTILIRV